MKQWHYIALVSAVVLTVLLIFFKVRRIKKVYLTQDLTNISSGEWKPKAGEYLGELSQINYADNAALVVASPGSALQKFGFANAWFAADTIRTTEGFVLENRLL
jgi:hypothetical protein